MLAVANYGQNALTSCDHIVINGTLMGQEWLGQVWLPCMALEPQLDQGCSANAKVVTACPDSMIQ